MKSYQIKKKRNLKKNEKKLSIIKVMFMGSFQKINALNFGPNLMKTATPTFNLANLNAMISCKSLLCNTRKLEAVILGIVGMGLSRNLLGSPHAIIDCTKSFLKIKYNMIESIKKCFAMINNNGQHGRTLLFKKIKISMENCLSNNEHDCTWSIKFLKRKPLYKRYASCSD
ncbi:hypothetical protein BpHYR1_053308 [Brachionus plicatilis]|uniref:Uncharacterized protein n=1 Tax=Brachionus plicatilis TaxID=10195 RepID=A0A3M7T410_BRAPC|nr:hypothetical protein BpHYR1_053308 [Brachionus plicatilis]